MQPIHEIGGARFDVFAHGQIAVQLKFLRQITDAQAAAAADVARIGLAMARENAQQTGLAGTIAAHQANFLTGCDRERDRFQQTLVTISQGQIVGSEDGRTRYHDLLTLSFAARNDESVMSAGSADSGSNQRFVPKYRVFMTDRIQRIAVWISRILASLIFLSAHYSSGQEISLDEGFARPPASARPCVYWFWVDGNVTRL